MKILNCSACTNDHEAIDPEEMDEPWSVNGATFTHHFFCPDSGVEVLVRYDKIEVVDVVQRAINP